MTDDEFLVALEAYRSSVVGIMSNIKSGYYDKTEDSLEEDLLSLENELEDIRRNL